LRLRGFRRDLFPTAWNGTSSALTLEALCFASQSVLIDLLVDRQSRGKQIVQRGELKDAFKVPNVMQQ